MDQSAHHANFVPWQRLAQQKQAKLMMIPLDHQGYIDQPAYQSLLEKKPKIVALTHVSNVLGCENDVQYLDTTCETARRKSCD